MIASALKKLLTQIHFPKRESVEERAQKIRRILTRKTLRTLSMTVPVQLELMKRYKDSQTCSLQVHRMTMSKILTLDGVKLYNQ